MARIFMSGNEAGSYVAEGWKLNYGSHSRAADIGAIGFTPQGNSGDWALRTLGDRPQYYPGGLYNKFTTATDEFYFRMHLNFQSWGRRSLEGIFAFYLETTPGTFVPLVQFAQFDRGNQFIGIVIVNSAGSTVLTINQGIFDTLSSTTYLVEAHVKLHAANGLVEFWVNDTLWGVYNGPLVGPGGETTADTILLGSFGGPFSGPGLSTTRDRRYAYDDIAINSVDGSGINDGRIGGGVIVPIRPNGVGSVSQLTNAHGNSVDNYKHVNRRQDLPDDPTGHVRATAAGQKDAYKLDDVPTEFGGVNAVMFQASVAKNSPSINNVRFGLKSGAQLEVQTGLVAIPAGGGGIGAPWAQAILETNTNTGVKFTPAELDDAEMSITFEA